MHPNMHIILPEAKKKRNRFVASNDTFVIYKKDDSGPTKGIRTSELLIQSLVYI